VIVIDEYLAVRVLRADWPDALPDDELGLPASRHWRLLQAVHNPRGGQLSQSMAHVSPVGRDSIRHPHPAVVTILDPRPLLDDGAAIAARFGTSGWLTGETLAAALANTNQLWFGSERNVGRLVARAAPELGITIHIA